MNKKELEAALPSATIYQIAATIKSNWFRPYFGAKPYIEALKSIDKITDAYYEDSGPEIVARFLGNASTWRGETARAVKKELNRRLKENK